MGFNLTLSGRISAVHHTDDSPLMHAVATLHHIEFPPTRTLSFWDMHLAVLPRRDT